MRRSDRPAPRYFVERDVELRFDRSTLRLFGASRNISETGMLIVSEDPKPRGTPVQFLCRDFRGRAEVVWWREGEDGAFVGLRFTHLEERDREVLRNVLKRAARF